MRTLCALVAALATLWPNAVQAFSTPTQSADTVSSDAVSNDAVSVWYRGSEGCPDGDSFIALLRRLGRAASLARVGDRVDFVVTVAYAERESNGRLERQNSAQTVAIRDVSAASCSEVAEVLALSLDLAQQPAAEPQGAAAPPPGASGGWEQRLGAQVTLETGLARAVLPGALAFIELAPHPHGLRLRLSLRGAYGERDVAVPLTMGLLASRAEACWARVVGDVTLGPCGGVDVGVVFAESSGDQARSDFGFWSSAAAHARASWQLGRLVALEAQVGALVPFVRYQLRAQTGEEVSGSAAFGLQTALGFSIRF